MEREFGLGLLCDLVERARHRVTPHLVTVLDEAGGGKTRILTEFARAVQEHVHLTSFQVGRAPLTWRDSTFALQTERVSAVCGVEPEDSLPEALDKPAWPPMSGCTDYWSV
ncbi:hypothetical protein [Streptomyces sp. NPDC054783]